jgi:hypothetical protein
MKSFAELMTAHKLAAGLGAACTCDYSTEE